MVEKPVEGVVIGTPLDHALAKLKWSAEGEWSAHVLPEECRTLLGYIEEMKEHPLHTVEVEPAVEEEQREIFTLTITGADGRVLRTVEVDEEDFGTLVGDTRAYTTGAGQILQNVHDPAKCEGRACVIHNPSDHAMSDFPTCWRADRGIMERICPHGVGHPDPDDMTFLRSAHGDDYASAQSVHGCDGCCRS